jgi:glycosyltransferase involved in cell wall biosynthesis
MKDGHCLADEQPSVDGRPRILIAHPGRQHSHQAALALLEVGFLGCYATGIPISQRQFGTPWVGLLRRLSVYEDLNLPLELTRTNMIAPVINRLFSRRLPEYIIGPFQYETYRIFDHWVAKLLKRCQFDAVVAYENSAFHTFRAAKENGVKCILDAASLHYLEQDRLCESMLPRSYKARVDRGKRAEIALADAIFVPSDLAARSYRVNVRSELCLKTIPLGVDINQFRPCADQKCSELLTFIFVGSATKKKGFDLVLEAMQILRSQGFAFRLFIAGVVDRSLLAGRWELKDDICEFGMVSQGKLPPILANSHCLLLPSRFDSFGMVVAEAMACGVPAIVSDMVGAKQFIENGRNGFIVPVGCLQALVDQMRWCIVNRDHLRKMSAFTRVSAGQVSWARYRRQFVAGVKDVMHTSLIRN